jgi:hypothetical protein
MDFFLPCVSGGGDEARGLMQGYATENTAALGVNDLRAEEGHLVTIFQVGNEM